ncbi:hypothetical protein PRNP1_015087 [Phytophthora ramorum]
MTCFRAKRASDMKATDRVSMESVYSEYENVKTPQTPREVESGTAGPLRGGGAPNLFTEQHVGLVMHRVGQPYFLELSDRHVSPNDYTTEIEARLNRSAASEGGIYVTFMMFAAFGYALSDVCADGVVVELAQREPLAERGRTQSTIYATRTFAATVGQILTGVAFNGAEYGGSFDFSLTFPQLMLVLTVCVAPIIPVTWFYIEESTKPPVRFSSYVSELWRMTRTPLASW